MSRLKDRVALITGGNSGIGKATALRFAAEGAHIVLAARGIEQSRAAAAEIEALGVQAYALRCDVRSVEDCQSVVNDTLARFGRVDVLFNNAGIVPYGTVLSTSVETWRDVFDINVHGTFYMSRAVLQHMIAQGKGVIINNASDWAVVGAQNAAAYAATKGAVVQLTRSMALDHARQGIRVNAICPGDTYVDRWRSNARGAGQTDAEFEAYLDALGAQFPLGRVGRVEEIANAVLFLASDESSYMTGQLLIVDGGNTAGGASANYS